MKYLIPFFIMMTGLQTLDGQDFSSLALPDYVEKMETTPDFHLIDVRTSWEYKRSHIEGANNISYLGFGFRKAIRKLDTSKAVFIYCQTAHRSPFAAKILKKAGFDEIYDLDGGYKEWLKAGLPVEHP